MITRAVLLSKGSLVCMCVCSVLSCQVIFALFISTCTGELIIYQYQDKKKRIIKKLCYMIFLLGILNRTAFYMLICSFVCI